MKYILYSKHTNEVVNISESIPSELPENLGLLEIDTISFYDLDKYNVTVLDQGVLSRIKSIPEQEVVLLGKQNQQQGIELSEREINEIMLGMQISDIEIQLLELQLGRV